MAATAVAIGFTSAGSAEVRTTVAPTIYFVYAMNCTFTIMDDSGKPVTSVAPGTYQVDVRTPIVFGTLPPYAGAPATDMTACRGVPQFQLTGPGVNLFTTMAAGCVSEYIIRETLQPDATYVAQDLNQPSVAHASFTTLASGTPTAPVATYGGGKTTTQSSTDIVGSLSVQGTLDASVSPAGVATLTLGGHAVSKVPAGRYKLRVVDHDAKAGLSILGPASKAPVVLAGAGFTGTKATTIALSRGRWTYFTSLRNVKYFTVR